MFKKAIYKIASEYIFAQRLNYDKAIKNDMFLKNKVCESVFLNQTTTSDFIFSRATGPNFPLTFNPN